MRIAMIGTGYASLVSGACCSAFGTEVDCVDRRARARLDQTFGLEKIDV